MSSTSEVFKHTFAFLEQNIDQNFYCEDFDKKLAAKYYDFMLEHHSEKDLSENRADIRRAFKSYFLLLNQKISLFFNGFHSIIIKDLKKQIYGEFSKQFHTMSQSLSELQTRLDEYKTGEDIYMIGKDDLKCHGCDFENIDDSGLKKELYRQAARNAFELHERDLVFFMNDKLTIKKFTEGSGKKPLERRAGGLPPEELEKLKNIVFEKNIYDEISNAIDDLTRTRLDFTIINNEYFRKNVIPFVQDALYKVTSIYMDEDSDVALKKAFVNYIFREHFGNIHKMFAQRIMDLHTQRDKNVENFLRYYDGNVELLDGKQVQKPEIIDANDQKWNAVSILPIAIQKQKNDQEIEQLIKNTEKAERKVLDFKHRIETIEEENQRIEERKGDINEQIKTIITESKELQDENYELKKKQKKIKSDEKTQSRINELSVEIRKYRKEEDRLRILVRDLNNSIDLNKVKITNINIDVQAQEKLIKDNNIKKESLLELHKPVQEKYELILEAIAKTLMKKY